MDRIQQLLTQQPGLKAQQIAKELGLDRAEVAAALHGVLGADVIQDSAYRWWPKTREQQVSSGAATAPRTFLANLCRYYLECLARESGSGISIPVSGRDLDYVVLNELPFAPAQNESPATERAIKKLLQKVRRERSQLTLYLGYALRLQPARNEQEMRVEPVLLYPLEETTLRPGSGIPLF